MIKEIQFSGYSAQPSDYESKDGDLSASINLVPEDGALSPVLPPAKLFSLDGGKRVLYIHETANFRHYIVIDPADNILSWLDDGAKPDPDTGIMPTTLLKSFGDDAAILQVNSIGNTLLALASDAIHYFLWKGIGVGYLYLGIHLPELPISFGLQGEMLRSDEFEISFDPISYEPDDAAWQKLTTATDPFCADFSDDNKTKVTSQVLAKVNKFIAENATAKGRFIFPFLVRYAYRLYDGSLTMHSSPVLMVCSSDVAPDVAVHRVFSDSSKDSPNHAACRVIGIVHSLDYACLFQSRIDALKNWKDIVRSVDVFISKPIYTYDQSGSCTGFIRTADRDSFSVCKLTNQSIDTAKYPVVYQQQRYSWAYAKAFNTWQTDKNSFMIYSYRVALPRLSPDTVKANILSCAQFYLLKSIKLDDLKTARTVIAIEDDYLQSLVTREVMTDDFDSHDSIVARYSFAYNQRINLANIQKRLYAGYNAGALLQFTDGCVLNAPPSSAAVLNFTRSCQVFFHIKQDGKDIVVGGESFSLGAESPVLFLYYPSTSCYKATIVLWGVSTPYEVSMEAHNFLNGAVFMSGWDGALISSSKGTEVPSESSDDGRTVDVPNKIYTSEVNNPFIFPVLGINTVGTGEIKGICAAAKALSQGQFGQFPLYAFTTEGVWALEVSSSGSYSARQPITRDVCINPDAITQLDSAVLFPSDRGIMLISGSQTQCISEAIKTEYPFDLLSLPHMQELHDRLNHEPELDKCLPMLPFTEFLKTCRMIYDYVHQRIIVYNSAVTYAYVYSLKSQLWGMMFSRIASHLNSYPEALAVDADNAVLDFSQSVDSEVRCLYVSRPLKLDAPDVLKTVDCVIQRGIFRRGGVATVLYGSRDLVRWHLVWSSRDQYLRGFRGSPYKYFRIAGLATLRAGESISGASVQFSPRQDNQPR